MELDGQNGQAFRLVPIAYEFPEVPDVDFLVLLGQVSTDGGAWSFRSAAMTMGESLRLGAWLISASQKGVSVTGPDEPPTLTFEEPNLGFSVASFGSDWVHLRAYFSHACAAPWRDIDDQMTTYSHFVELQISDVELEAQARSWLDDLQAIHRQ